MKIVLLTAALKTIPTRVVESWCALRRPAAVVEHKFVIGMPVDDAYNLGFSRAITDWSLGTHDIIVTLEHDNLPGRNALFELIDVMAEYPEYSAIGGLYYTRGTRRPQIWGPPAFEGQPEREIVQECNAVGMGFTGFRAGMFVNDRYPWFKTLAPNAERPGMTQDLYFWSWARRFGMRCAVDTRIRVGHYQADIDFVW